MTAPRSRFLAPALLCLALGPLRTAGPAVAAPLDTHQLLRFHSVVYDFVEGTTWDEELVLFRDGAVVDRLQVDGSVEYRHLRMPAAALAELRQTLAAERVGQLRADGCKIAIGPNTADFRGTLTWFGKGRRTVHLEVNDGARSEVCPEAVERLFLAVIAAFAEIPPPRDFG